MDWEPYRALYVHVPFCKQRCLYCDFNTCAVSSASPRLDEYTQQMIADIRKASRNDELGSIETVYFGGGTPTYLGNARLSSILYTLSVSMHLTPEVECTVEANPDSLDGRMVKDIFALGATRVSLGVQSFNDDLLRFLGRVHSVDQAKQAIAAAQTRFENVSIDLMCGLPGQTEELFRSDLETALSLGVKHVSVYPLMVEEGTPLDRLVESGRVCFDEDAGADLMLVAAEVLQNAGMRRYEVASYAYPGYESRHNTAYWTAKPYLGLGKGAVSMRQNQLERQRVENGRVVESLDPFQMAAEDLMLRMRMSDGVPFDLLETCGILLPQAEPTFQKLQAEGYVRAQDCAWVPTEKGWLFGNHLFGELYNLAP